MVIGRISPILSGATGGQLRDLSPSHTDDTRSAERKVLLWPALNPADRSTHLCEWSGQACLLSWCHRSYPGCTPRISFLVGEETLLLPLETQRAVVAVNCNSQTVDPRPRLVVAAVARVFGALNLRCRRFLHFVFYLDLVLGEAHLLRPAGARTVQPSTVHALVPLDKY